MMKKEIKDIFQQRYNDYSTEVDTNELMAAIDRKRQGKKKRSYLFLFPLGLIALVISVAIYISFNSNSIVDLEPFIDLDLMTKKEQAVQLRPENDKHPDDKDLSELEQFKADEAGIQNQDKIITQNKSTKPSDLQPPFLNTSKANKAVFESNKTVVNISNHNSTLVETTKVIVEKLPVSYDLSKSMIDYSSELTEAVNVKPAEKKPMSPLPKDKINSLNILQELDQHDLKFVREVLELPPLVYKPEVTVNKEIAESRWSVNALGGVLPFKYASAETQKRKAVKPLRAITTSLLLKYKLSNKLSISTGIELDLFSELFEWEDAYITDSNGDYFSQVDPEYMPNSFIGSRSADIYFNLIEVKLKTYNDHKLINLPLYVHYRLLNGKTKWMLYAMGSINVHQSSSGYFLNDNNQHLYGVPEEFSSSTYISKMSWGGGMQIEFDLVNKFHFLSQLGMELKNLTETNKGTLLLPRLQFGIGFRFN